MELGQQRLCIVSRVGIPSTILGGATRRDAVDTETLATTEGSFKQSEHNQTTATVIRDRAVEAAAANLNADSRYREFMMQQAGRG